MNVLHQPSTQSVAIGAAEAVRGLRDALVAGDVDRAQAHRWLQPRPPGERDLLSDLAAAEGVEPAVRRLSGFWRRAEVHLEQVRTVSSLEAEVYERVVLPGESLPIVSLVRRESERAPWGVVCTNEAHDERFVLWISVAGDTLDDVAWSRAFTEPGELLMTEDGGVLGHPDRGWLVHVRGPFAPDEWPEGLPESPGGDGGKVVELTAALAASPEERRDQLQWILAAGATTLRLLDGTAAYRPRDERLLLPEALELASRGAMAPAQAFHFWARTRVTDGHVVTDGLHLLGLPELEAPLELFGDKGTTALVEWLATSMVTAERVPSVGTELVIGDRSALMVPGRRGRRRGHSYGRWSANRLEPVTGPFARGSARGSRTRMRVPPTVLEG